MATDNTISNPFIKLNEKQRIAFEILSSTITYILLSGGSSSGKTFVAIYYIILRAIKYPGSRHLIARNNFTSLRTAIIDGTFISVMRLISPEFTNSKAYEKCWNKQAWTFTFPNGSIIIFSGVGNEKASEKLLGNEYVTIFLDEASEINYASYQKLKTRLRQKIEGCALKFLCACNPPEDYHWTYYEFVIKKDITTEEPLINSENIAYLQINPSDNLENIPEETINILMSLPEYERERFFYGNFTHGVRGSILAQQLGQYPANFSEEVHYNPDFPVYTSWDLGFSDAMAIVFWQWYNDTCWIIDYYENTMQGLPHYIDVLNSKGYKYQLHVWPHDGKQHEITTGNTRLEYANTHMGPTICLSTKRHQELINAARTYIPIIKIDKNLTHLLKAIKSMRYEIKDGNLVSKSIFHDPKYSHGAMAFLYTSMFINQNRNDNRFLTKEEKTNRYYESIREDIKKGLEANLLQLTDDDDD